MKSVFDPVPLLDSLVSRNFPTTITPVKQNRLNRNNLLDDFKNTNNKTS